MHKRTSWILTLKIWGIIVFTPTLITGMVHSNSILFCLKKNQPKLELLKTDKINLTNDNNLNQFLTKYNISDIGKWLNSSNENDIDGEINLNNIYRITLNGLNRTSKSNIMNHLRELPNIYLVEE